MHLFKIAIKRIIYQLLPFDFVWFAIMHDFIIFSVIL